MRRGAHVPRAPCRAAEARIIQQSIGRRRRRAAPPTRPRTVAPFKLFVAASERPALGRLLGSALRRAKLSTTGGGRGHE